MKNSNHWTRGISLLLVGSGVVLLVVYFLSGGTINLALPLVFVMLGGSFVIVVPVLASRWRRAMFLYVPAGILIALGIVFLINVLTGDWQAWAYAWLLLVSGAGVGMVYANQRRQFRQEISLIGWGLCLAGITLFVLFGAIAKGKFIQVMAPILLALGGLLLFRLRPQSLFSQQNPPLEAEPLPPLSTVQGGLVEPLSVRELEVLRLVDQGLSNAEIAERLVLAPSTIKTHINNIYGKLGVQTRVQAINKAKELLILD